jgi:hypothetical protein
MDEAILGLVVAVGTYAFGWVLAVLVFGVGST